MNIRCFSNDQEVFVNLECVSGFSFKYALLGDNSVLLPVKCSAFALQRDSYENRITKTHSIDGLSHFF